MAKVTFQGRIPEELMAQVWDYCDMEVITATMALEHIVKTFFNPLAQDHADQGMLIRELEAQVAVMAVENEMEKQRTLSQSTLIQSLEKEVEKFRSKPDRIPTPKKKRQLAPLSQHTKARLQVLRCLGLSLQDGKTSSELAHQTNQNTNNVAKRLAELSAEGYVEPTGEYRVSRDSAKRLALWRCTGKPLPKEFHR